jgi:uncharacterized membrane protein YphA (DoxX/SURF4 family)
MGDAEPAHRSGIGFAGSRLHGEARKPGLSKAFLEQYPLNFTAWLGIPMSNEIFALCAGSTELVIGLCLMIGCFPRTIILTAWVFINMTLTIFN